MNWLVNGRILILAIAISGCTKNANVESVRSSNPTSEDQTATTLTISSPVEMEIVNKDLSVAGTCLAGVEIEVAGDITPVSPFFCTSGKYKFSLRLSNGDGNKEIRLRQLSKGRSASASVRVKMDDTSPQLSLITPATNANVSTSVILEGLCEGTNPVVITTSAQSYSAPCTSGNFATTLPLTGVADGTIVIQLSQSDSAENSSSLSLTLKKDTIAPVVAFTSPAANSNVNATFNLTGTCETGHVVEISGTGLSSMSSVSCVSGTFSASVAVSATSGTKAVIISQTDAAGNKGTQSRSFNYAAVGPAIAITSPAANSYFTNTVAVSGTCQSGLPIVFSGSGWISPASTTCTNGTFTATVSFTASDGVKTLIASQTNTNNETGASSRSFTRDQTAPTMTISNPAANTQIKSTAQLAGTCEPGLTITVSGTNVSVSPAPTCSSGGSYSTTVTLSGSDGNKTLSVAQTDVAGNTTTITRTVVKDATSPLIAFTSPAVDTSAETGLSINGSCESGLSVSITGAGVNSAQSAACSGSAFSANVVFSAGDGSKLVQISQTDAAGNTGSSTRTFIRLTPTPVLDGVALYNQHCSICHSSLAASTKRGRSAAQISSAINSISQMSSLKNLSTAQVNAIATALGDVEPPALEKVSDPIIPLGNRTYLESLYNDLFVATSNPTADDTKIKNLTSSLLLKQVVAHGGPCLKYDASCNTSQADTAPFALGSPSGNSMRKGYTTRTCEQVLEIDKSVTNVLGKVSFTVSTPINQTNVQTLFLLFNPGKTPTSAVLTSLVNIGTAAKNSGYSTTDQWRFTLLPLCLSSTLDIL